MKRRQVKSILRCYRHFPKWPARPQPPTALFRFTLIAQLPQLGQSARGCRQTVSDARKLLKNPHPKPSIKLMSTAKEQATREQVTGLLAKFGMPEKGTMHTIRKGAEQGHQTGLIDPVFHPQSAVLQVVGKHSTKYYDRLGCQVFAN